MEIKVGRRKREKKEGRERERDDGKKKGVM